MMLGCSTRRRTQSHDRGIDERCDFAAKANSNHSGSTRPNAQQPPTELVQPPSSPSRSPVDVPALALGWSFSSSSPTPLKSLPSPCKFTRDASELPPTLQNHIAESIESGRRLSVSTTGNSNCSTPISNHSRSTSSATNTSSSTLHSHSSSSLMSTEFAESDLDSPPSLAASSTPSSESPPTEIRVCPLGTPPLLPLDGQSSEPEAQPLDLLVDDPPQSLASPRDTNAVGWFHAFTPAVGTVVRQLDYSFVWTEKHPRISELMSMRQRADPDADELLAKLKIGFNEDAMAIIAQRAQRHTATMKEQQQSQPSPLASDECAAVDADCFRFLWKYATVPSWVDWDKIAAGQRVFQRYGPIGLLILLYSSLIGGFGAPLINKVLNSSNNLSRSCPAAYARLVQTSLAILACMGPTAQTLHPIWSDPSMPSDARAPSVASALAHRGDGWMSSLRTRFLHAQVRKMLLAREGGWDTATYGLPINQEDSQVTLMSFSFNMIDTLKRLGIMIAPQEKEDYMHLWKYIGFLSGVDPAFLESTMTSYDAALPFTEAAWFHLVHPDRTSQELVRFVLSSVQHCFPFEWSPEFHSAVARVMLTPAWSAAIGLPAVSRLAEIKVRLMFGWLWTISKLSYLNRWIGKAICYVNFAAPSALSSYRFGAWIAKRDASKRAVIGSMAPLDLAVAAAAKLTLPLHHPALSDASSGCPFLAQKKSAAASAPLPPLQRASSQLEILKRLCNHAGCEHGGCRQSQLQTKQSSSVRSLQLLMVALVVLLLCGIFLRSTGRPSIADANSAAQLS